MRGWCHGETGTQTVGSDGGEIPVPTTERLTLVRESGAGVRPRDWEKQIKTMVPTVGGSEGDFEDTTKINDIISCRTD
ncbi:hypothetical protein X777_12843 [Ooceraea biroi]|uniref:Uncharacterized protein n=1 Tax=Ooceraea biroi TaxID=2015173 RepID=A0A026VYZ5_OOCBI|nr:hypothetical protein X777_12843 [Ooceraea biroi]